MLDLVQMERSALHLLYMYEQLTHMSTLLLFKPGGSNSISCAILPPNEALECGSYIRIIYFIIIL